MASLAKTIVTTGASSGLGFEAIKQLLQTSQPYRVIVGARNSSAAQAAYDGLKYDPKKHNVTVLPLELNNLRNVRSFANETLSQIGNDKIDYLLLNAAISTGTGTAQGPHGSKWSEAYIVNHLSQHYLVHLLREKLVESKSRLVFVSSGAVRRVPDTSVLEDELKAGSGKDNGTTYPQSKFVNLLAAHWWRRQLSGTCDVVAVSPGLIPGTGIGIPMLSDLPDAKSVPEGAQSILQAFTRDDFPEDPEQIFLTSWGEWWPKDVYGNSLDKTLQDKFCPSKEELEKEEGIAA